MSENKNGNARVTAPTPADIETVHEQRDRLPPLNREPQVEDIQNDALNIVATVREPLLILDATLRVRSANRAF